MPAAAETPVVPTEKGETQMERSPLDIRFDNGKYFITIKKGMRIEGIGEQYKQPEVDLEYQVMSVDSLMLQEISTNERKTLYTFAEEGDQIVVIENTRTEPSAENTFIVDDHKVTVSFGDGYSYTIDGLPFEPNVNGFVQIGDTLIKADKALESDLHLIIQKKFSLL